MECSPEFLVRFEVDDGLSAAFAAGSCDGCGEEGEVVEADVEEVEPESAQIAVGEAGASCRVGLS